MGMRQPTAANRFGSRFARWLAQQGMEIVNEPGTGEEEKLFQHLLAEITAYSPGTIIPSRKNQRLVRTLEPQNPDKPGAEKESKPGIPEDYEAPRDDLERIISGLWEQVLGFERIGIYDNFFDLGGDSLTATQLVARINEKYPVEVSIKEFFKEPTIASLAGHVKKLLTEKIKNLSPAEKQKLAARLAAKSK
jgi:acyl carrier protein